MSQHPRSTMTIIREAILMLEALTMMVTMSRPSKVLGVLLQAILVTSSPITVSTGLANRIMH